MLLSKMNDTFLLELKELLWLHALATHCQGVEKVGNETRHKKQKKKKNVCHI